MSTVLILLSSLSADLPIGWTMFLKSLTNWVFHGSYKFLSHLVAPPSQVLLKGI
jgi:hypothetical protein